MTTIQQVVFEMEMDYIGHPYYVSGNAILHAIAPKLTYEEQTQLNVSHGMFALGVMGVFPDEHTGSGARMGMGSSLPDVEAYDDLFLTRHQSQSWLPDTRPRDVLNTHDLKIQSEHPTLSARKRVNDSQKKGEAWYIHCYLHEGGDDVLPLAESVLDGVQFGGKRNYGYGLARLNDTQTFQLEDLDYSWLEEADEYLLELVTPFVLETEHPHADNDTVPWWWGPDDATQLRTRKEVVVEQREQYDLKTVDHGQVVSYEGPGAVETAKNGVRRVGTHSKYGFGELRVKPL